MLFTTENCSSSVHLLYKHVFCRLRSEFHQFSFTKTVGERDMICKCAVLSTVTICEWRFNSSYYSVFVFWRDIFRFPVSRIAVNIYALWEISCENQKTKYTLSVNLLIVSTYVLLQFSRGSVFSEIIKNSIIKTRTINFSMYPDYIVKRKASSVLSPVQSRNWVTTICSIFEMVKYQLHI